jgi:hypothetical protein
MVNLLTEAAPCLILLNETLEYLNKALGMRAHDGNLAATTLTVIKELCTAASNARGAAIIATLTSSRLEDYATVAGEEMQERLSKVVGRTENIVTPVEGDDIFPILHTRLFESIGDQSDRRAVADAYVDWYEQVGDVLPQQFRETALGVGIVETPWLGRVSTARTDAGPQRGPRASVGASEREARPSGVAMSHEIRLIDESCKSYAARGGAWLHVVPTFDPNSADGYGPNQPLPPLCVRFPDQYTCPTDGPPPDAGGHGF